MNRTAPVCKLGHVQLSTPDIDASLHFFRDLVGLDVVGEDDGKVYLRAWNEIDHHSLVVRIGLGDFLRMAAGELEQVELLKARRIDLVGDGLLAARLGSMFGRPAPPDVYVTPPTVDPPVVTVSDLVEA